jgi:hypothetical protein
MVEEGSTRAGAVQDGHARKARVDFPITLRAAGHDSPMGRRARVLASFSLLVCLVGLVCLGTAASTCKGRRGCDSEEEEEEERGQLRDNLWRARVSIVGRGAVKTREPAFDCTSDGVTQEGRCGPELLRFKELSPPLLEALPAPGWRLDRWESLLREPDGASNPRRGRMPDGRFYLNGFGYEDTGELETVTAVFVPDAGGD